MLVEKEFQNGDIVSIKLSNGEELVAKFEDESSESIIIYDPLTMTVGANGQVGMVPWVFLGGTKQHKIRKNHVLTMVETREDAAKRYMESETKVKLD